VIVDQRDPAEAEPVPVEISSPSGLPDETPASWQLNSGSRLSGEALDSAESALTEPSEISGNFRKAEFSASDTLTITSIPSSTTLLLLPPSTKVAPPENDEESHAP